MATGGWLSDRARDGGIDRIPLPAGVPGALWLCGKHAIGPDPVALLARVEATTVVCLNHRPELEDRYPDYVAWLDAHAGTDHAGTARAVWFPIDDLHAPPLPRARQLVAELRGRLDAGESLVMHCGAGIGRAGTMAAAVLLDYGMDAEAALALVAASRPMAGPEVGAQQELIEALADELC